MKTRSPSQQTLQRVGENLYRSDSSAIYYAILKRDGKQIHRSLKTTDPGLAGVDWQNSARRLSD